MNKLYSKQPIGIDFIKCVESGKILSFYEAVIEKNIWSDWDIDKIFTFKLVFISICHDFNWDFLQNTLANVFSENPEKLEPTFLANLDSSTLKKWLSSYEKPERIRASERSKLIRSIGEGLLLHFGGSATNFINDCDGTLMGEKGLYFLLDKFSPYREDPLRKKTNVLIHDLTRERIFDFPDIDQVKPAIEYHIMRLYERTGRIFARKKELHLALINGDPLAPWFVKEVREVASEALSYTAHTADITVPDLNYIEWQIARNVCKLQEPNCNKADRVPDSLPDDISRLFEGSCPYIEFCYAFNEDRDSLRIKEPIPAKKKTFY